MRDRATLRRRLADLPDLAAAEFAEALRQVGDEVVAAAQAALAAENGASGGRLAASLTARVDEGAGALVVGSDDPEAALVEFGARRRGARPFLRPAVVAVRSSALRHVRDAMGRAARRFKEGT